MKPYWSFAFNEYGWFFMWADEHNWAEIPPDGWSVPKGYPYGTSKEWPQNKAIGFMLKQSILPEIRRRYDRTPVDA